MKLTKQLKGFIAMNNLFKHWRTAKADKGQGKPPQHYDIDHRNTPKEYNSKHYQPCNIYIPRRGTNMGFDFILS